HCSCPPPHPPPFPTRRSSDLRTGSPQPVDEQFVLVGHVVAEERRTVGRAHATGEVGVLERDRQTVQRRDVALPTGQSLVGAGDIDRKSTRLNSVTWPARMPSS